MLQHVLDVGTRDQGRPYQVSKHRLCSSFQAERLHCFVIDALRPQQKMFAPPRRWQDGAERKTPLYVKSD